MTTTNGLTTRDAVRPDPKAVHRFSGLDGVRGMATIVIIFYHVTIDFFPVFNGFGAAVPAWSIRGAYVAVDLFFVMSGYLITTVAFGDQARHGGRIPALRFYKRRAYRVFPAIIFFVVGHAIYAWVADFSLADIGGSTLVVLTGSVNYSDKLGLTLTDAVSHLWTLSIEMQFYLVVPLVVTLLPRRKAWMSFSVLLSLSLLVAFRRAHIYEPGFATIGLLTRTDSHVDGILLGVALAYVLPHLLRLPRPVFSAAGWLGIAGWSYLALRWGITDAFTFKAGFYLAALCGVLLISSSLTDTGPTALFRFPPLIAIANVSFALYLWHILAFQAVLRWMGHLPSLAQASIGLALTIGLTLVSWNLVEKPAMRRLARREGGHGGIAIAGPDGR